MNTTSKLSIASFALVGLFATGCSQQQVNGSGGSQVAGSSQQVAGTGQQQVQNAPETPAPAPEPVAAVSNPNSHAHPAVPGCTNSITHTHPNGATSHNHKYGCKGHGQAGNRHTHSHPAVPQCTKSIKHTHKYNNRNHTHKYSCKGGAGAGSNAGNNVNVHALQRKLKAKGFYRGPINGVVTPETRSALQRYMQNR